jgi:2-dehydro-3-deoxyphosphogluconate aldolase/(4S)-4-hydroxy-2-oxoglutarate aldolase
MDVQTAFDSIVRCGMMAGLRGRFPPSVTLDVTRTLLEKGINVLEFTMNSVQPLEAMQAAKRAYGDDACVGMGTVLDKDMAKRALDAGADFIVAPSFSREVVEISQQAGVLVIPGVITPTEAVDAWATGVKMLKIFPIGALGLDYFKAIRGPLDHIPFCCNGAMDDTNVGTFIKAGAVACGLGTWLTGDGTLPLETIARRAHILRDIVDAIRSGEPVKMRV